MRLIGILFVLGGWVLAMSGLFMTSSNAGRLIFACAGIAVSIFGILGILNRYYLARAIWKK
ncbi:MAG: hypothetical protein HYS07_07670 [Chlamydiae bacterium]|nr:hypothetical protein [Chlamydiota bacterium]MBI3277569.1 hypothetical protein [Chlamydiota bacterium]